MIKTKRKVTEVINSKTSIKNLNGRLFHAIAWLTKQKADTSNIFKSKGLIKFLHGSHQVGPSSKLTLSLFIWCMNLCRSAGREKYYTDILHVSFSSGPWLESLQRLISLAFTVVVQTVTPKARLSFTENDHSDIQRCPWLKNIVHKSTGAVRSEGFLVGIFSGTTIGNKCPFSQVSPHLELQLQESGKADGWMQRGSPYYRPHPAINPWPFQGSYVTSSPSLLCLPHYLHTNRDVRRCTHCPAG